MEEKLIELVGKSEELRDMSNKKYSDSVAKEKSLGTRRWRVEQIWFPIFFITHFGVTIIPLFQKF